MRNYFLIKDRDAYDQPRTLIDSRDYGIYISGSGTWTAPPKKYNVIQVPGRNGDLLMGSRAFENGIVTYPDCFIYADFETNLEGFRADLMSLYGYAELHDSYHTGYWRQVFFPGGFDPVVEPQQNAGRFSLEFNSKPQKWLASGLDRFDMLSAPLIGNPSRFYARPRIEVYGTGTFKWSSGGKSLHQRGNQDYNQTLYITVSRRSPLGASYPVVIDSETMLCYVGANTEPNPWMISEPVNWGQYVKITTDAAGTTPAYEFPEIRDYVEYPDKDDTITGIWLKPRWWTI